MIKAQSLVKLMVQRALNEKFMYFPAYNPVVVGTTHNEVKDEIQVTVNITVKGVKQTYFLLYKSISTVRNSLLNADIKFDVTELYINLVSFGD